MAKTAGRPKKETVMSVKMKQELLDDFKTWADGQGLTVSSAIRNYMAVKVQEYQDRQFLMAERMNKD